MFIATLVAPNPHETGMENAVHALLEAAGCVPGEIRIFGSGRAIDVAFGISPGQARRILAPYLGKCDIFIQPVKHRRKTLLISDMDSTMIAAECIDELADYAGVKNKIAAITDRAMQGELDFAAALKERVALLKGLPEETIDTCLHERIRATPGAGTLVATMHSLGAFTVLVSGGFHAFADPVGAGLGFNQVFANALEICDGKLSGNLLGDIVDAQAKAEKLTEVMRARKIAAAGTLAIGDGANDIPMLQAAALGIAYHAKPAAREAADAFVAHNDLTAILWAQGIDEDEWVVIPER